MSLKLYKLATIIEAPVISEKCTIAAEKNRHFVFKVKKDANKVEIKEAVEAMFNVQVDSVNVLNVKGKEKRSGRSVYHKSDWKKAYVKLKPGHDIEFSAV